MVREPKARGGVTTSSLAELKAWLRAGEAARAWSALRDLDDSEPDAPELWYLRSLAAQQQGDLDDAQASADRALALAGGHPYFLLQAGRVASQRGVHDLAIAHFEAALNRNASLPLAWAGLGASCVAMGKHDAALVALRRAVALGVSSAAVFFDLARLELAAGRLDDAATYAQQAARDPKVAPDALLLEGEIHQCKGEVEAALKAYRQSQAVSLADPRAGMAAATLLWREGRWDEALRNYAEVSSTHPDSLRAALGAGLTLPHVYESHAHLQARRAAYAHALGRLSQLPPARFRKPVRDLLQDLRWTNFMLAYHGQDDRELQSAFGDLLHAVVQASAPEWLDPLPRQYSGGRKIRVGFASHFFYDCTVGRYFSSWVLGQDHQRVDVYVYYTNARVSQNTEQIKDTVEAFRHMPGASILSVAEQIRQDAPDILVYPEIGMHPDTLALACLRLAPVQCAAWGHPTTTGLPTIDWFLSCETMEPEAADRQYRERLALLPGLGTAYARPGPPAAASRRDLGLPEGKTLYLIPQSAFKIHPDNDSLIASVIAASPNAVGVLFAADAKPVMDALVQRLKPVFESYGLSTERHLMFMPAVAHDVYLAVNQRCDVMLDTLHWSGGNTALDALSVGLPIVTQPGALMRGRQSAAMLRLLGLEELIVDDQAAYVRTAIRLGTDVSWREGLRARILKGLPSLFDDRAPVRALNDLLPRLARGTL